MLFENIDVISLQNKNTRSLKFTRPKTLRLRPQGRILRVAQDQITTASSAPSQHSPGQNNRQTMYFFIHCRVISYILLCLLTDPDMVHLFQQRGGSVSFQFCSFFICRNSSGRSGRQSQWTKSSESRQRRPISCCARWKNTGAWPTFNIQVSDFAVSTVINRKAVSKQRPPLNNSLPHLLWFTPVALWLCS